MNRKFAKPKADNTPEYAPDALVLDGRTILAPKEVHYRAAGYLPLSPDAPVDPPEGKHYERQATIEPDGAGGYRWTYALVDNPPPPPRRWSRRSVKTALANAGKWEEVKAMLVALDKYEDMLMCDFIEETNDDFQAAYKMAVAQYGKEAVDAIIDTIETEGV